MDMHIVAIAMSLAMSIAEAGNGGQSPETRVGQNRISGAERVEYCGRLRVAGGWYPRETACKSLPEWQELARFAAQREQEKTQVINIGAAGNR